MRNFFIFTILNLLSLALAAQDSMFQRMTIPVIQNGQTLAYPFAGGMNAPLWSPADLNNDGVQDIVVFDRVGNTFQTFVNNWTGGIGAYKYAPDYARTFPKLQDYVLLRDYNQDGATDIFCASPINNGSQEIHVYRGYFDADNVLRFEPFKFYYPNRPDLSNYICYPDQIAGLWNNFQVATSDVPAIDDIDGDGDLDIVHFAAGTSTYLTYLQNQSVERGFGLDSLQFVLADVCWGKFFENGQTSCFAKLSTNPDECAPPGLDGEVDDRDGIHPGATTTTFDSDGDGDKDVLIGNISYDCLLYMRNGGNATNGFMDYQEPNFPSYDEPVDLRTFPSAHFFDVDLDGKKDLVVSPNFPTLNEDRLSAWWYQNVSDDDSVKVELATKRLFVGSMLDFGTASHPAFADVNGDGLLDLVVGNYGFYANNLSQNSRLVLFLNTGTPFAPQFTLSDSDWLGMSQYSPNDWDFAPAFGDLDADGDQDLLVGSNLGALYCFFNAAGSGNPMNLQQSTDLMWTQMDVGLSSMPCIVNFDGDNRADILIGERTGNINLFLNTGSPNEPNFTLQADESPNVQFLGGINTAIPPSTIGFSAPVVIPTASGRLLISGSQGGQIEVYSADGAPTTTFPMLDASLGNVQEGFRSCPAFADLDADGVLEMMVGNQRGGLSLFKLRNQAYSPPVSITNLADNKLPIVLQPNPASDYVQVTVGGAPDQALEWMVYDLLGRQVAAGRSATGAFFVVDTQQWPAGMYQVLVARGTHRGVARLVVTHGGR
jgi:hypothetical protein